MKGLESCASLGRHLQRLMRLQQETRRVPRQRGVRSARCPADAGVFAAGGGDDSRPGCTPHAHQGCDAHRVHSRDKRRSRSGRDPRRAAPATPSGSSRRQWSTRLHPQEENVQAGLQFLTSWRTMSHRDRWLACRAPHERLLSTADPWQSAEESARARPRPELPEEARTVPRRLPRRRPELRDRWRPHPVSVHLARGPLSCVQRLS